MCEILAFEINEYINKYPPSLCKLNYETETELEEREGLLLLDEVKE